MNKSKDMESLVEMYRQMTNKSTIVVEGAYDKDWVETLQSKFGENVRLKSKPLMVPNWVGLGGDMSWVEFSADSFVIHGIMYNGQLIVGRYTKLVNGVPSVVTMLDVGSNKNGSYKTSIQNVIKSIR